MTRHVTFLIITLNALAVYRATRLVTRDTITKQIRQWVDRKYEGWLATLLWCPWCVSVYAGAVAVVMTLYFWPVWQWVCLGAACSAVAGFLDEHS